MRSLYQGLLSLLNTITGSKSINEDAAGKALVAHVLVFGGIMMSLTAVLLCLIGIYFGEERYGVPLVTLIIALILFIILHLLCRVGKINFVAYVLVGLNLFFGIYISARWGVNVPESLIIYAITIVISSMLVSSRFAFFVTIIISAIIYALFFLVKNGYLKVDSRWRSDPVLTADVVIYAASLGMIYLVGWLSSTQVEKSLERVRTSEAALKKERDSLEVKVEERTSELKRSQAERIEQIDRFVEFGKLSSGIFHDLINYLNIFMLYFEKAASVDGSDMNKMKEYMEEFESAKSELYRFIDASRKQLKNTEPLIWFSPEEEIKKVIHIFSYISKKVGVSVSSSISCNVRIMGDPIKFSHIITAIVSNAIDSYADVIDDRVKSVSIIMRVDNNHLSISIEDNGCGISKENIDKIFEAFYTTKEPDKGTGLGLSIVKNLIAKDFGGEVAVESVLNIGSIFTIKIPLAR